MKKILLELVNCDLCGSKEYKIRYRQPDMWTWLNQFEFPVVECINCGLIYVNPRPTPESMAEFYPKDYHDNRDTEKERLRYENQLKYLPDLNHKIALDIGCAKGDFLAFLLKRYPSMIPYGIDYYSKEVKYKEIQFFNKTLEECGFDNDFFDVIFSFAVFEHLHFPSLYFKECARTLKKNGELIILVPNAESFRSKIARMEDIPRHLYFFTTNSLTKYGYKFGLRLEQIFYDDEIFEGRGFGTIRWLTSEILKIKYEDYYFKKIGFMKRAFLKMASILDNFMFSTHWEKALRRSGIIIARFRK